MKKEFAMPEMKVSKFSIENIVTDSGIDAAKAALGNAGVTDASAVTEVDFDTMFKFSN